MFWVNCLHSVIWIFYLRSTVNFFLQYLNYYYFQNICCASPLNIIRDDFVLFLVYLFTKILLVFICKKIYILSNVDYMLAILCEFYYINGHCKVDTLFFDRHNILCSFKNPTTTQILNQGLIASQRITHWKY